MDELRGVYADKLYGGHFRFGQYPQDADGGIKPILWRVLRREPRSLLAISELGLDSRPYNEEPGEAVWAGCSLRRWLNGVFFATAFNELERALIVSECVCNNAGPATKDRVFLLSSDEAEDLLVSDGRRRARATEYAVKQGVRLGSYCSCWWWLRSRGRANDYAGVVISVGDVSDYRYIGDGSVAVRPAVRLAL
ncbi:MAG: DUF6273 domain-containing protein [bacterium]|nr:DUF6273 domain-containing protein [bacterium]